MPSNDGTGQTNSFVLNGNNLVDGARMQGRPVGGNENGGTVTLSGGQVPFEADDVIVIEATGLADDGAITSGSEIVSITVYDSVADHAAGNALYVYAGTEGQTATVSSNTASLGDTYVGFNATPLTADDPAAPPLGQVFVAAGVDLNEVADGGSIVIDTIQPDAEGGGDGNFAGTGDAEPLDDGPVICFLRGTLIDTPHGPLPVESLRAGDLVTTMDDGPQPLRWTGRSRVDGTGTLAPILIRAGALGNLRDLLVSPNHRMLLRGPRAHLMFGAAEVLVAAKHLVDGHDITIAPRAKADYHHVLFDRHQIVWAEGCPSESLYVGEQTIGTVDKAARAEIAAILGDLGAPDVAGPLTRRAITGRETAVLKACA